MVTFSLARTVNTPGMIGPLGSASQRWEHKDSIFFIMYETLRRQRGFCRFGFSSELGQFPLGGILGGSWDLGGGALGDTTLLCGVSIS